MILFASHSHPYLLFCWFNTLVRLYIGSVKAINHIFSISINFITQISDCYSILQRQTIHNHNRQFSALFNPWRWSTRLLSKSLMPNMFKRSYDTKSIETLNGKRSAAFSTSNLVHRNEIIFSFYVLLPSTVSSTFHQIAIKATIDQDIAHGLCLWKCVRAHHP